MPNEKKSWFFRAADGAETGPLSESDLRGLVVAGEISSETPVSRGDGVWKPALAFEECGFDCLVLRTEPSLDVLGPFSREYLDRPDVMETLPGDGQFFVRSGTVATAAAVPGASGPSGSALVERVLSAERALRDTVGKLGELGKLLSELDEAKKALAVKSAAFGSASKALADAKKALVEKDAALADAKKSLDGKDAALADAKKALGEKDAALADAKKSLGEKDAALADAKKALGEKDAALADAKKALGEKDAALADAKKALGEKDASLAALRGGVEWMRGAVSDLLSEAGRRFGAAGSSGSASLEVVEPEVVVEPEKPAPTPEQDHSAKMAALESQLQKELRMAGAAPLRKFFKKR